MPRTPKSTSQRQRWTLLSFFSSGFSDRPTAASTTTTTSSSGATKPSPMKEQGRQEKGNAAEESSTNDKDAEEEQAWIMLHDRDSTPFWLEKITGYWTYDGITVYGPPAPTTAATHRSYALHQRHQRQRSPPQQQHVSSQYVSYAQPAVTYYAPGPYTATQYAWKPYGSAGRAAPGTIPGTPGVFF